MVLLGLPPLHLFLIFSVFVGLLVFFVSLPYVQTEFDTEISEEEWRLIYLYRRRDRHYQVALENYTIALSQGSPIEVQELYMDVMRLIEKREECLDELRRLSQQSSILAQA